MTRPLTRRSAAKRAIDWLLCDRTTGRWTIAQRPNLPLILFVVLRLATIPLSGRLADVLRWAGTAALVWWALDEVARGVNPFRRSLGAVVLVVTVLGTVTALR